MITRINNFPIVAIFIAGFGLTPTIADSADTLTNLHSLVWSTDGGFPAASLVLGTDGYFYGTTSGGGMTNPSSTSPYPGDGMGTIFKISTNGTLTTLVLFDGTNGMNPSGMLTMGADGNFYGTTENGGSYYTTTSPANNGYGTVFRLTMNGTLTTLVSFNVNNGAFPTAGLTQGPGGNLYGTTSAGGPSEPPYTQGVGTAFVVSTNGNLTNIVFFNGENGFRPLAPLTMGNDGNLYGTTYGGGGYYGSVFKMTTNGSLTPLVNFNVGDGANPYVGGLTLGNDGCFYGTTSGGGTNGWGTVFKVTTNSLFNTLAYFLGTNGSYPFGGLTLRNDGNFYGTTSGDTKVGYGTIFKMTPAGVLTTLAYFEGTNGESPYDAPTLGADDNLYGTTERGGSLANGTIFKLSLPPPPPTLKIDHSGKNVVLSWTSDGSSFTLQFTTNFAPNTQWNDDSSPPTIVSDTNTVTDAISGPLKFYRLSQ